jgi:polar amino acid transport system substrate-binding protein
MNKLLITFITMVLFSLSSVGISAEKLVLVTSEWPPYMFLKDNQLTGIHIEIAQEACKRLGLEADIRLVPWARAMKYVEEGDQADAIFSAKKSVARTKFLHFPSEAIDTEKTVLVAIKQGAQKANSLDDLKGKIIGVVRDYIYDPVFDKNTALKKEEAKDDVQMMKKLDKQRTDLAIGEEGALKFIAKQQNLQEIETVYLVSEVPVYVAFSKIRKDQDFAEKFGQVLHQLKEEGFLQKIKDKYL